MYFRSYSSTTTSKKKKDDDEKYVLNELDHLQIYVDAQKEVNILNLILAWLKLVPGVKCFDRRGIQFEEDVW